MALSAVKTWIAAEILFASDLNAEFANIYTNGEDLGTPATKAHDMNGFEVTLDADGDSGILADTDDRIDMRIQGVDLFRFDGTTASCVNGLDFQASDTGNDVVIIAQGSDTNISVDMQGKGTGWVLADGDPCGTLAARVFVF
jgi:hypothetical protein